MQSQDLKDEEENRECAGDDDSHEHEVPFGRSSFLLFDNFLNDSFLNDVSSLIAFVVQAEQQPEVADGEEGLAGEGDGKEVSDFVRLCWTLRV